MRWIRTCVPAVLLVWGMVGCVEVNHLRGGFVSEPTNEVTLLVEVIVERAEAPLGEPQPAPCDICMTWDPEEADYRPTKEETTGAIVDAAEGRICWASVTLDDEQRPFRFSLHPKHPGDEVTIGTDGTCTSREAIITSTIRVR